MTSGSKMIPRLGCIVLLSLLLLSDDTRLFVEAKSSSHLRGRDDGTSDRRLSKASRSSNNQPNGISASPNTVRNSVPRMQQQPPQRRKLQQLLSAVINALLSVVTPYIADRFSYVVRTYHNTYDFWGEQIILVQPLGQDVPVTLWFEEEMDHTMDEVEETGINAYNTTGSTDSTNATTTETTSTSFACAQSVFAKMEYSITGVTGLGALSMDKIAFVPGSQDVNLVIQGLKNGATWEGQWLLDASLDSLTAFVNTKLYPSSTATSTPATGRSADITPESDVFYCDEQNAQVSRYFQQQQLPFSVNGTVSFTNLNIAGKATVRGDTERVILFGSTSQISSATVDALDLNYQNIDTSNAGIFEGDMFGGAKLSVDDLFGDKLKLEMESYVEELLTRAVQGETDWLLPRPLIT